MGGDDGVLVFFERKKNQFIIRTSVRTRRMKRKPKTDSDNEMLKEVVRVVCESIMRSRTVVPTNDKAKKSKWFNILSERIPQIEAIMSKLCCLF